MIRRSALVALAVFGILVATVPLPAAAPGANAAVESVAVDPSAPVPGEQITVVPTIRNLASSTEDLTVNAVALRPVTGPVDEYDRVRDLGSISPGATLSVPLRVTFDEPGTYNLRVVAFVAGESEGGFQLTYPVSVTVRDYRPSLALDVERPIEGVETTASLTLANGLSREMRNVELRLSGIRADPRTVIRSRIAPGETVRVAFNVTPEASGERDVSAIVTYTLGDETNLTTSTATTVTVRPLRDRITLDAVQSPGAIDVTVMNLGNAVVEGVVVDGRPVEDTSAAVGRALVGSIAPRESATVSLPVTDVEGTGSTAIRVDAEYGYAGMPGFVGRAEGDTVRYSSTLAANVTLTGINVAREPGGRLRITGSASNIGLTAANSVIVRVVPVPGVTPAEPNREFFVGTVPASDFVSFDVFAQVEPAIEAVPLEVSYLANGDRRRTQVHVPVSVGPAGPRTPAPDRNSGGLLPIVGGAVVIAAVGAVVYLGWRRRRADS